MRVLSRGLRVRRAGLAAAAVVLLALGGCVSSLHAAHGGLLRLGPGRCKPGPPLAGVYLPFRLQVKKDCVTVSGTVDCLRHEDDGDIHIRLRVDPPYRRLLTPASAFQQCPGHPGPHLVVEIIPQQPRLPFLTNSATLGGFVTPAAPAVGDHITVTGPDVWDTNALHDLVYRGKNVKNWAEIHPAWNVTVDQRPGLAASHDAAMGSRSPPLSRERPGIDGGRFQAAGANAAAARKNMSLMARTAPSRHTEHPDLEQRRDQAAVSGGCPERRFRCARNGASNGGAAGWSCHRLAARRLCLRRYGRS